MERFHNSLHNRKADPVASVLAAVGLIHLIELLPDMPDILIRDRSSGIKHSRPGLPIRSLKPDLHNLLFACMVERIADIITYHLFHLELVRPHIDRLLLPEDHMDPLLLRKNLHTLQDAPYKLRQIEPLKHNVLIPEFQLIQGQQVLHHLIHLRGLVYDHVTVEFPALLIIADTFPQTFRISLDQRNRRFKLMRNISQKLIAHLLKLFLLFNIFFQPVIGALEFGNGTLKLLRHPVKIRSQLPDLITAAAFISRVEIQIGHLL
ncbi:hypothetical protein IMSAGC020_00795 [Lachnospiraceae bacterium]|nr:hypothetical protein IMSAGC020_00795 [Lachnospiraceae bacterium]